MKQRIALADLLKKMPDLEINKDVLCCFPEDILNSPLDWGKFITMMVYIQPREADESLFSVHDRDSSQILNLLSKSYFSLYIFGHPDTDKNDDSKQIIWELHCMRGPKYERWICGGDILRSFCDANNLHYISAIGQCGNLISYSTL